MRLSRYSEYEFADLATYNAERARGIVHTPEWQQRMEFEQARFDLLRRAEAERNGWHIACGVIARQSKTRAGQPHTCSSWRIPCSLGGVNGLVEPNG